MSISALADDEILRTDRGNLNLDRIVNPGVNQLLNRFDLPAGAEQNVRAALAPVAAETPIEPTKPSTALDALVKYIPTESVTLYVAATAARDSLMAAIPWLSPLRLYWCFVVFTPVLFILIYIGKRRSQKLSFFPSSPAQWPWWKVFAATVAFMVWALAIPPLVGTPAGGVAAAFGALLISTILTVLAGVFEPT